MKDRRNLEPSYENLHRYTLNNEGALRKRPNGGRGGYWKLCREIERQFEAVFKRPLELADINPDVAMMLLAKWKREGMRSKTLRNRKAWFEHRNQIAVKLGWADCQDFSAIMAARRTSWEQNRCGMPLPKPPADGQARQGRGRPAYNSKTLTKFMDEDYIPNRLVGKSENTIRLYRVTIRNFSRFLGRDPVIGDLNTKTVSDYLRYLIDTTELSPHTIEKERTELTAFWNFCAKRKWLLTFPDIPSIPCPERVPDAWTNDEMVRLMKACEQAPGKIGKVDAGKFWPALISAIYDCGERVTATMQIKHGDVTSAGWLTVRGEYRKGKTRDKRYKLRPITVERIKAIKVPGQDLVFEWPYHRNSIWDKYTDILKAAGLPHARRNKFHMIRRTSATHFEAAGGNATKLLDHTDRRTTEAYLDPSQMKEQFPADICPGIGETATEKPQTPPDDEDYRRFQEFQKWQDSQKEAG